MMGIVYMTDLQGCGLLRQPQMVSEGTHRGLPKCNLVCKCVSAEQVFPMIVTQHTAMHFSVLFFETAQSLLKAHKLYSSNGCLCFIDESFTSFFFSWLPMHLNPTLYSVFLTGAGAWVPASFVGEQDQHVCVNKRVSIHLNLCVAVCALVSKGWDRQWREQKVPVPEVRSACRHDAFPFSRPPAANIHSQNGLICTLLPHQHPLLQLLICVHRLFASKDHPCAVKWPQHV